jgi:hypothetical protein
MPKQCLTLETGFDIMARVYKRKNVRIILDIEFKDPIDTANLTMNFKRILEGPASKPKGVSAEIWKKLRKFFIPKKWTVTKWWIK